jgi:hypothetical protein
MYHRRTLTPLGAVGRGLAAGAIGTLAMDLIWFRRYKRGGGSGRFMEWEFSSSLCTWDQAPAPAQIGKRLVEGLFQREVPAVRAALVNNLTHWADPGRCEVRHRHRIPSDPSNPVWTRRRRSRLLEIAAQDRRDGRGVFGWELGPGKI